MKTPQPQSAPRALGAPAIGNFPFSILNRELPLLLAFGLLPSAFCLAASPVGTAFTYQGRLSDGGQPADGIYDLRYAIYDAATSGVQVGPILTNIATGVSNGFFTVALDFGPGVFTGDARWLEIGVRSHGAAMDFTPLTPRQPLTATPYALHAPSAGSAAAVTGPVSASQLTGTISSNNIGAGSITTVMLAAGAVGANQLAAGAVTTAALADGAVTADKVVAAYKWSALAITNPRPAASEYFGISVAAMGTDRVLIGALRDDMGATDAGAAYLFSASGAWLTTFTNPTPANYDDFGYAVAAVGTDHVLIGAYLDDTGANNAGAAYLFSTDGALLTTFTNPAPATGDKFGNSVTAVGTDCVLMGAEGDDTGANDAGAAYLFSTDGTLLTTFTNPTPAIGDSFGWSVAAVGTDRVLIGARGDDTGALNAGAAYLFSTNGALLTTFTNPTPAAGDTFGSSVAAVGTDHVLIGAYLDDTGALNAGVAYLFSTNGALLTTFANPTPADQDNFGISVAAVGTDRVLIAAYYDDAGATDAGAAYLFSTNGSLLTTITNPTPALDDNFGWAVAAVGTDHVIIGASRDDTGASDAGAAYLVTLERYAPGLIAEGVRSGSITAASLADGAVTTTALADEAVTSAKIAGGAVTAAQLANAAVTAAKVSIVTNWSLVLTLTNPTPANNDNFASAVAAVGTDHLLVGTPADDTGAPDAGAAYLFDIHGTWVATLTNPTPETGESFGHSVAALGKDFVVIGAPSDNAGATAAGAAYLFSTEGTLLITFTNPVPAEYEQFGWSVAALGSDRLLIGAPQDADNAGAAYLFLHNGTLLTTFTNPTPAGADGFGYAIAPVGSGHVLVGAPYHDTGALNAGIACLFTTNGTLVTTFTNPTPVQDDQFGRSLAAVGNDRVLIAAPWDHTGAPSTGIAYLFSTNGALLTTFTNPTPASGENFGYSVAALGNNRLLIGAFRQTGVLSSPGAAYVFNTNGLLLATIANPAPANLDLFGCAVAAVGPDRLLIGANSDDAGALNAGAAYLFAMETYTPGLVADRVRLGSIHSSSLAHGAVGANQLAAGAVGSAQLADGAVSSAQIMDESIATRDLSATVLSNTFWRLDGNAGSTPGGYFLGTTDNQPLQLKVNNQPALRLVPDPTSPCLIGGHSANWVGRGSYGSVIAGGGQVSGYANFIADNSPYSVIGGGFNQSIETNSQSATIAGGFFNGIGANTPDSTIGGGGYNQLGRDAHAATVAGGYRNSISMDSPYSAIGGGTQNDISSNVWSATIAGGTGNRIGADAFNGAIGGGYNNTIASNSWYSAIAGGVGNRTAVDAHFGAIGGGFDNQIASRAQFAAIPGGGWNVVGADASYALAAGRRAKANHPGTFVWGDSTDADFASTGTNQFLIRASGGVGIGTDNPAGAALCVAGPVKASSFLGMGGPLLLGTTDNQPLEFQVNGLRALRLEDNGDSDDNFFLPDGAPNVIGGSPWNCVAAGVVGATIAGGGATNHNGYVYTNSVLADFGAIGGGGGHTIYPGAESATIGGGYQNAITNYSYGATIGGGIANAIGYYSGSATVGGGSGNRILGNEGTIGGGYANRIQLNADDATIGGGFVNEILYGAEGTTISGGRENAIQTNASWATIGGGGYNSVGARAAFSAIGGGSNNIVGSDAFCATVAGGRANQVGTNGDYSTIGGGSANQIAANASCATIPGGSANLAGGAFSFAAGRRAKADRPGSFVWADSNDFDFHSFITNQFAVRATGGYWLCSGIDGSGAVTAGVVLPAGGGSWGSWSDRNSKTNVVAVDARAILDGVLALPVATWSYRSQDPSIRHVGPMAQDFQAMFGVGESARSIASVDADGVALAAIQGLNQKVEERSREQGARSQELEARSRKLEEKNAALEKEVAELKALVKTLAEKVKGSAP